jgi:polyhydroxybutyrate depolymerase
MLFAQTSKGSKLGMRLFLLACSGCSSAASPGSSNAGGSTSNAGAPAGGAKGGSSAGGDSMGTGGSMAVGGSSVTGGTLSNAGAPTAGGSESAGGATTGRGGNPTGGAPSGGMVATGGSPGRGGGGRATGGMKAMGGVPGAGGSQTTGGATALGGTPSTGGTSAGGASNSTGCSNTALPAACNTSMTGPCTIDVGGTARQYFAVLPNNYAANTAYPIVFLWHGANTTAQMYIGGGPIAYYGIRTGFPNAIYVAAQGLPSTEGGTDYGWANTNGRDVDFTKAMIESLESNYCVDKSRVFSTGFSYGGIMSLTLACQMADVFRAIGVMSGTMFGGTGGCQNTPIPAWFTHGEADTTLPISGGESARDALIKRDGCDTTNTQTAAMSDGITMCTIYDVCTSGDPVVWCPVPGETHQIPSFSGPEIAKFFLQY